MEFSHIFSPDGPRDALLSQGRVLKRALAVGTVGRTCIPRTGKGEEPPTAGGQLEVQPQ